MSHFNDLELDEITEWPLAAQLMVIVLLIVVIQASGYWFYLSDKQERITALVNQEQRLKTTLKMKADKAARLPQLQAQLQQLSQRYRYLLQQLPEQKELASMLAAVNELGIKHQLSFTSIYWGEKKQQAFLNRLPLNIELSGRYHDIGRFSAAIAELPRIIYFEHVDWQRAEKNSQQLSVNIKAYTYQYQMEVSSER